MTSDIASGGGEQPRGERPAPQAPSSRGAFFAVYKHGQGYWTRMLSAGGAMLITFLTAEFIFNRSRSVIESSNVRFWIAASVFGGLTLLALWAMNRPAAADFLIATDSEMKKVNWTSKQELIGSTKVVIFFMLAIALVLFVIDLLFSYLFTVIGVLQGAHPLG